MTNTYPFPSQTKQPTLDGLALQLVNAKKREDEARKARVDIEEAIIKIVGVKDEGSFSLDGDQFKVTTTGKINRTLNEKLLPKLRGQIPAPLFDRLIGFTPKLNLRELRYIELNEPDYYKLIAPAITVKPAKPTVAIKEINP